MSDSISNSMRQSAELELLASMYPTEYTLFHEPSPTNGSAQEAKCSLQLQPSYTLELSLPAQYPDSAAPVAYLECGGNISTTARKEARAKLASVVSSSWEETGEEGARGECLDMLVEDFADWLGKFCTSKPTEEDTHNESGGGLSMSGTETNGSGKAPQLPQGPGQTIPHIHQSSGAKPFMNGHNIKRVLMWSHHLLATSKRKDILTWSRELRLGGYSRPGYPGAIFVEGEIDSVDEFVQRMKALRWQALQVRAEEIAESRVCGDSVDGVTEVEGLGEVVEGLKQRDEGVARFFLDGMKISAT